MRSFCKFQMALLNSKLFSSELSASHGTKYEEQIDIAHDKVIFFYFIIKIVSFTQKTRFLLLKDLLLHAT